jgi:hypothetical protein
MNETPEYYENQAIAFLADSCKEKDKTIRTLINYLVLSVILNLVSIIYFISQN